MTKLYTFILDYQGGTFASQHRGNSLDEAYLSWLASLPLKQMGLASSVLISPEKTDSRYSELAGLVNTWCTSLTIEDSLAIANIVLTSEE